MSITPLRVIVNADDFGMSESTTDHIVACIDAGLVTSTTVMGNGPDLERALGLAADRPQASFGVHLNATQFAPLTSDDRLSPLLVDGEFVSIDRRALRSASVRAALVDEFTAQVGAVSEGVAISHLDSHHMIHWLPELLPVIKRVARRTGVHRIRTVESFVPMPRAMRLKRRLWREAVSRVPAMRQPDEFQALSTFVMSVDEIPEGVRDVELMVHPGHPSYADETALLLGGWRDRVRRPLVLTTFNDLGP